MNQPNYFVLIAADADRNRRYLPSAFELAKYRIARGEWGLKSRTRFRGQMKCGDRVLFYLSGNREWSQHFIGSAILTTGSVLSSGTIVDAPDIYSSVCSEYKISFREIEMFDNPICVRDILTKLDFVSPNRTHMWRIYFQGGAIKIYSNDFKFIKSLSSS